MIYGGWHENRGELLNHGLFLNSKLQLKPGLVCFTDCKCAQAWCGNTFVWIADDSLAWNGESCQINHEYFACLGSFWLWLKQARAQWQTDSFFPIFSQTFAEWWQQHFTAKSSLCGWTASWREYIGTVHHPCCSPLCQNMGASLLRSPPRNNALNLKKRWEISV